MTFRTRHGSALARFEFGPKLGTGLCISLTLMAGMVLSGCGSSTPFPLVTVTGKVVYEDGAPVPAGKVFFSPLTLPEDGIHPKTGVADINSDGSFDTETTYKYGDGIVKGKHKVAIMQAMDAQGNSLVPPGVENFSTTPLEVDTADSPLVITVAKPDKAVQP